MSGPLKPGQRSYAKMSVNRQIEPINAHRPRVISEKAFREQQSDAASKKTGTTTRVIDKGNRTYGYGSKPTSAKFSRGNTTANSTSRMNT